MSANNSLAEIAVTTPVAETTVETKVKAKPGPKPKAKTSSKSKSQIPKIELTAQNLDSITIEATVQSSASDSQTKSLNLELTSSVIADFEPQDVVNQVTESAADESDSDDELFESIKNKSAAVEIIVVDYTPLELFDYVLKSHPQLDKLEVYVKHPGDTGAFDKYWCPVIFMKVINTDGSTKMLKYEKFSKDVFSVIVPRSFVEQSRFEQAFCVVIYKPVKTYKSTGKPYRRIQVSTDDFEDIIAKYIAKYNISTLKPSKLNKDDMAELGLA
jgi:hypothetical protein